jgi:doublecortin-like kinase 1/2
MVSSDLKSLKIIDFGYATPINLDQLQECSKFLRERLSCTANYMAPELYLKKIDKSLAKCDVFALGVILINFLTGHYPFHSVYDENQNIDSNYAAFMEDSSLFLKDHADDKDLIDLVKGMLQFNDEDRFSIQEVLDHKWLNSEIISTPDEAREEILSKQNVNSKQIKSQLNPEGS